MPLLKSFSKEVPAPEVESGEPKSFALAYSMKTRKSGPTAATDDGEEAPASSIAEAILRKRKAAMPPAEEPDEDLSDNLEDLDALDMVGDLMPPEVDEEERLPAPRDRIDAIMRRKRASKNG